MSVPYPPIAIANWFIAKAAPAGYTHMKLQKLVYCAHGWWLARQQEDAPALVTEDPEVWRHGPVFASLYRELAGFGNRPITTLVAPDFLENPPQVDEEDLSVHSLLAFIMGKYGGMTAERLSELTHQVGSPWQIVAREHNYKVPRHLPIPKKLIRREFFSLSEGR